MTDQPAAIQATFADFRLIKGRKQAQLVLEIPIEEADNALAVLGGIPQPQSDCWVAVARLNGVAKPESDKEPENTKLSFEAVKRCREHLFQTFIGASNEEQAAQRVRIRCGISSRGGLNTNQEAAQKWREIDAKFLAWKDGM